MEAPRELALFAGAGGGILGGILAGWRTVCAVEIDPYCRSVLLARQRDGMLPTFPIWDDVRTFDGRPWHGHVDIISGGFPCQDISSAGKGAGIDGPRSGLWSEFARIIREVEPSHVLVENSPALTARGLGRVLGDLASMGYDARWGVLGAATVGAPHRRYRIWIVAHATKQPESFHRRSPHESGRCRETVPDANGSRKLQPQGCQPQLGGWAGDIRWWDVEPDVGRVADGIPRRLDRLRALGNGQVPAVARRAWEVIGGKQ